MKLETSELVQMAILAKSIANVNLAIEMAIIGDVPIQFSVYPSVNKKIVEMCARAGWEAKPISNDTYELHTTTNDSNHNGSIIPVRAFCTAKKYLPEEDFYKCILKYMTDSDVLEYKIYTYQLPLLPDHVKERYSERKLREYQWKAMIKIFEENGFTISSHEDGIVISFRV